MKRNQNGDSNLHGHRHRHHHLHYVTTVPTAAISLFFFVSIYLNMVRPHFLSSSSNVCCPQAQYRGQWMAARRPRPITTELRLSYNRGFCFSALTLISVPPVVLFVSRRQPPSWINHPDDQLLFLERG